MNKFNFTNDEVKVMDYKTNVALPTQYERGDYESLAVSMNSVVAANLSNHHNSIENDISRFEGTEFNPENLKAQIDMIEEPEVRANLLQSNIYGWNHFINRTNYIKDIMSAEKQVSENFSTAGMLAAGLPMALLDADSLLISPILAGVSKARKALSLESRMAKVAEYGVAGAIGGGVSMAVYENATGIYKDDSLTNSALMGMALGGTLGVFATRASKPAPDYIDEKTNEKIDIAIRKEEELTKANTELSKLDDAIAIQKNIEDSIKANKERAKAANTKDITDTKSTLASIKEDLIAASNKAKEEVTKVNEEVKLFELTRQKILKQTKDTVKEIQTLLKAKDSNVEKAIEVHSLGINKEIAKLTEELNGAINAKKPFKAISNKLDKLKAEQKAISAKVEELSSIVRNNNHMLKESAKAAEELKKKQEAIKKDSDIKAKSVKEYDARYTKDKKIISDYSKKLGVSIDKAQELLTKDGMKNLLASKGLLTSRIADIKAEKLDLLGVRKEVHNYVTKLTNELEGVNKEIMSVESLSTAGKILQRLPDWASKLVISPIENLYKSKNPLVSGLASMLHTGTLHRGKVDTRTTYRIKQELDEMLRRHTLAVEYNYRMAVKDGYQGSKAEFETDVSQNIYKTIGKLQRDMSVGISGDKNWKERLELMKKANVNRTYYTDNKHIISSVDEMLNYYEAIHKRGSVLGLQNFIESNGRGYVKRFYDRNKILDMGRGEAIEHIYLAQKSYAESNNFPLTKETLDEFREKATTAVDASLNRQDKRQAIIKDFGMPRGSTTSPFKQRSIDAYDDDLSILLEDDIFTNSGVYALNVHGRIAFKEKLGVDNEEQLMKLFEKTGATNKELDNLKVVAQGIMGTREIAKNPFTPGQRIIKGASSLSSLLHTAAFGVPTLTEVASIAKEFGWKSTIENLVPSIGKVKDIYLNGTPSDKNQIELIGNYGSAYFTTRANRMDIDNPLEASSYVQEKIDGAVHKLSVLSGLLPITDMLKMTTITAGIDFLAKISVKKNISPTDMMRVNDMGFDASDLAKIKETLKVDGTGRILNMDRKSWGALDQRLTDGLLTMVDRTILHPNAITLPKFMTDVNEGAWVSRIMMKFMRFPVESYERLLLRGVQEADAKQLLALGGNVAMWTAILMAKDVIKDEEKQQYNKADWETKLFKDSLLANSWTSFPVALADKAVGLATGKNLTNDYTHNALGVVPRDLDKIRQGNLTVSLPFYNMNVGDATGRIMNDMFNLDELMKD